MMPSTAGNMPALPWGRYLADRDNQGKLAGGTRPCARVEPRLRKAASSRRTPLDAILEPVPHKAGDSFGQCG